MEAMNSNNTRDRVGNNSVDFRRPKSQTCEKASETFVQASENLKLDSLPGP